MQPNHTIYNSTRTSQKNTPNKVEKSQKVVKESPYVHRYTSYLKDLESNWAYYETNKKPKHIYGKTSK